MMMIMIMIMIIVVIIIFICCSRGFVRALGFRVTRRATPVGSWGGLGLRRALRAIFRGSFMYPVSLRGGSQRSSGFAEPSC